MKMKLKALAGGLLAVVLAAGCQMQHTPHVYNPFHWGRHLEKVFHPETGELHEFHLDIDQVIFGVDNYEFQERTEYVYSD